MLTRRHIDNFTIFISLDFEKYLLAIQVVYGEWVEEREVQNYSITPSSFTASVDTVEGVIKLTIKRQLDRSRSCRAKFAVGTLSHIWRVQTVRLWQRCRTSPFIINFDSLVTCEKKAIRQSTSLHCSLREGSLVTLTVAAVLVLHS